MTMNDRIRPQLVGYLQDLHPLTVVELTELYALPFVPEGKEPSVRSALYGVCAGTPVSERERPGKIYGIRLKLSAGKQVVLSLPGIPREYLKHDHKSDTTIERIIRRLTQKYGAATIDFWAKAAQRRSVDQASVGMRRAKSRDGGSCLLCKAEGATDARPVSACHIISRKASFWLAIDEVDKTKGAIFTEEATRLLSEKLKNHEVHSDPRFIVTLCKEHNDVLLKALASSLAPTETNGIGDQSPLFQERNTLHEPAMEKIVEIGGEGGSITLWGARREEGAWAFRLVTDENGLVEMLGETPVSAQGDGRLVKTWRGALKLLARYPWKRLFPLYVHPDFTGLVATEISRERLQAHEWEPWNAVLFPEKEEKDTPSEAKLYTKKAALLKRALAEADRLDKEQGL